MTRAPAPLSIDDLLGLVDAVARHLGDLGGERGPDLAGLPGAFVGRFADGCELQVTFGGASAEPEVARHAAGESLEGLDAVLEVPLAASGGPEGVLRLGRQRPFAPEEVRLAQTLGRRIAGSLAIRQLAIDRARLADALEAERARLEAVIRQMPGGVVLVGASGEILLSNDRIGQALGVPIPDRPHLADYEGLPLVRPDGAPLPFDAWPLTRALREGVEVHDQLGIRRPDGTVGTLRVDAAPVRDRLGEVIAAVAVMSDVSETARLIEEVREAVHTREKTLSIVSHDLKNPLQVVVWNARQLRRHADKGDSVPSDTVRRIAEWFEGASRKMTTIVDDLLDASRLQAGKRLQLELNLVDLVPLVRRVADELQQDTSRHTLTLTSGPGEVVGRWDEQRLERVLGNVIGNAIKYSPQGGAVRLTVEQTPATAADGPDHPGWAVVRVQDEGIGIPPAEQGVVFEWFRRASNVPAHLDGTGLGLPSARLICEQHGGRLELDSRPDEGATFTLALPLVDLIGDRARLPGGS